MPNYRPNVQEDPTEPVWLDSREETLKAINAKPSTEVDDERKCETPAEYCMFVGLVRAFREIEDIPGQLLIQHQVGRCRLDFAIIGNGKKIDVEVDGESFHSARVEQDRKRDRWLESQGWTVMRYTAKDVMISRHYACWAGDDVRDFYLGNRTLEDIQIAGYAFANELEKWYPHLVVPIGTCVSCRGSGRHYINEYDDLQDCEQCDGTGEELRGKRSKIDWVKVGWDWEEEWAGVPGVRPFQSILGD